MGNVSSRPDEGTALYLRDQTRCKYTHSARGEDEADKDARTVTISSLSVINSRRRTVLNVVPNAFPATRVSATRDLGDNSVVEFVQV
jgi:Arf-GAP/SH3 domain/ANK repeat/PH domain-containing protein